MNIKCCIGVCSFINIQIEKQQNSWTQRQKVCRKSWSSLSISIRCSVFPYISFARQSREEWVDFLFGFYCFCFAAWDQQIIQCCNSCVFICCILCQVTAAAVAYTHRHRCKSGTFTLSSCFLWLWFGFWVFFLPYPPSIYEIQTICLNIRSNNVRSICVE